MFQGPPGTQSKKDVWRMCTVKALQIPAHGQQGTPGSHLGHPVLLAVGVLVCQQTSQGVLCLR